MPVKTVHLPRDFPPLAELTRWNQQFRSGQIALNWSKVGLNVSQQQILTLLCGTDLDNPRHVDQLGMDTMSDEVAQMVLDALDNDERQRTLIKPGASLSIPEETGPGLWHPEDANSLPPYAPTAAQAQSWSLRDSTSEQAVSKRITSDQLNEVIERDGETTVLIRQLDRKPLPVTNLRQQTALRQELTRLIVNDLLGPVRGEQEEIHAEHVQDRYVIGVLAPLNTPVIATTALQQSQQYSTNNNQNGTRSASQFPSTMGIRFCVERAHNTLQVRVRWGQYLKHLKHLKQLEQNGPAGYAQPQPQPTIWRRKQRGGTAHTITLHEGKLTPWSPDPAQPAVQVSGTVCATPTHYIVNLSLINGQHSVSGPHSDSAYLFQPELVIETPYDQPVFQRYPTHLLDNNHEAIQRPFTAEQQSESAPFAYGQNVSVQAEISDTNPQRATRLTTTFLPITDIPSTEALSTTDIPALQDLDLDMLNLAKTSPLDLAAQLTPLSTAYEQWITEQEQLLLTTTDHNTIAQQRVGQALQPHRHNLRRLRQGIELLRTKPDAAQAFIFMNRAMGIYSHRTRFVEEYKRNNRCDPEHFNQPEYRRWLPLQLSFILINISALSIVSHIERSRDALADLLCYTDGQQKTATYLGLAAYTLGIRLQQRVIEQRSSQEGVAVILRYAHLHDVAIQLQHATTLICACEIVRRGSPHQWGTTPLRSGLWLTQNPQDQHTHLDNLLPLTNCPWCGTVLRQEQDVITEPFETGRGRTLIYCSNNKTPCPFSRVKAPDEGLPLVTVEEEIYRLLPALLITVDAKLTQLIHNNETRRLFGEIDMYCERHGFHTSTHQDPREASQHPRQGKFPAARSFPTRKLRPPDLIIYDEIVSSTSTNTEQTPSVSNEAMLDHLTTWNNRGALVRPKVIVATANMQPPTFALQVQLRRAINLFPPHGYNEQDTFFTRQQHLSMEQPGQLHLGIPVIGQSKKSVIRRVYLTLLAATQALYEQYREQADPWMTLVSYLHSTNDIAILQQLVEYDVSRDLAQMAQHGLTVRHRPLVRELTTQSSILDIQRILNNLEQSFGSDSREKPIDVLLADNAITVCHAIKRLNLLVIVEAPHTPTKDQLITSSIGNTVPGLICTIYDYAHPHKKA